MATAHVVPVTVDHYRNGVLGKVFTVHSITTAGSGATSTGTSLTVLRQTEDIVVTVVTSLATGAVATLNVFIDSRINGTNWTNIARSAAITATGSTVAHLTKRQANGLVLASADAGAGTNRAIPYGDDIRIRTSVEGTATTSVTATMFVTVMR